MCTLGARFDFSIMLMSSNVGSGMFDSTVGGLSIFGGVTGIPALLSDSCISLAGTKVPPVPSKTLAYSGLIPPMRPVSSAPPKSLRPSCHTMTASAQANSAAAGMLTLLRA